MLSQLQRIPSPIPGNSGDEIELEPAAPPAKPRLAFAVANLARTAKDLRDRSLTVRTGDDSISVADPDGTVIVFAPEKDESPKEP